MKRENGKGSISKMKGKRSKPFRVSISYKDGLTTKRKSLGCYSTRKEAERVLLEYQYEPTEKTNITLSQVYNEWSSVKFNKIDNSTINNYQVAFNELSELHSAKFRNLRTAHYQKIIDGLQCGHSKLQKLKSLLKQLYNYAVMTDILHKNYAEFIELPSKDKKKSERFYPLELHKIFKEANNGNLMAMSILIMCYTGFRPKAFLNLTIFNYDDKNKTLTGGVKTTAGKNRVVNVSKHVQPYVEAFRLRSGSKLILDDTNTPYSTQSYYRAFKRFTESIGITGKTPYACRHTFISMMVESGSRQESLKQLAGHENFSTTVDNYSHISTAETAKDIDRLIAF